MSPILPSYFHILSLLLTPYINYKVIILLVVLKYNVGSRLISRFEENMFGFGTKIAIKKIQGEIKNGSSILVDVRRKDEWDAGHAAGAIHLPIEQIINGEVPTTDAKKKLYFYCVSGNRAGIATSILKQKSYQVENIGGLKNWVSAGGQLG